MNDFPIVWNPLLLLSAFQDFLIPFNSAFIINREQMGQCLVCSIPGVGWIAFSSGITLSFL